MRFKLSRAWRKYRPLYRDVLRIISILVTFQQISTSVVVVVEVPWPANFVAFMSYFSVVNIDLFDVLGVSCVGDFSFNTSFIGMCGLPACIVVFATVNLFCQLKSMHRRVERLSDKDRKLKEEEALHQLFHVFDDDGSGSIGPAELAKLLGELGWAVGPVQAAQCIKGIEKTAKIDAYEKSGSTEAVLHVHLDENTFVMTILNGTMTRILRNEVGASKRGRGQSISSSKDDVSKLSDADRLIKWTFGKRISANALAGATSLLLLSHTPLSRKVFQYFHCRNLAGRRYLFADYDVRCESPSWFGFLPVVLVVLASFTLLLPLSIGSYLYQKRKLLYTAAVQGRVGWLYAPFVKGAEGWMVHDVSLKMVLTGLIIVS